MLALTGNIGAGKSTVAKFIKSFGYKVVDLDAYAKKILLTERNVRREVVNTFGEEILDEFGKISIEKLAKRVFSSKRELDKLTAITHPYLVRFLESLRVKSGAERVFVEAAVVFEYGWECLFDAIILIFAYKGQRFLRASKRFSLEEVIKRESFQMSYSEKIGKSDFLVCNTKDMLHLKTQAQSLVLYLEAV